MQPSVATQLALCKLQDELQLLQKLYDTSDDQILFFFCLCPAGTGKTTTLVKYAEQRPHLRFLYVAFNKSVANEAQRRFPSNVISKTVHSLAFADIGKR